MKEDSSNEEKIEEVKEKIGQALSTEELYELIFDIIYTYMDMDENDVKILALWSMCVAIKDCFETIPFLFINASKGSGKTRLLKLLEQIIPNAKLTPNLKEASIFRLPAQQKLNCLLIDEAERLSSKEKADLKELLNTAYKKGGKVLRTEKVEKERFEVKEYDVYMGIALANIWGLESVLEDRCITIILEKSNDPRRTSLPELFALDDRFERVRKAFLVYVVYVGSCVGYIYEYIFKKALYYSLLTLPTLSTLHTYIHTYTQPTLPTLNENIEIGMDVDELYELITNSGISGRDLELWLPLFLVSALISKTHLEDTIEIAKKKIKEKKEQEMMEDRDVIFSSFLYYYLKANNIEDLIPIRLLKQRFEEIEGTKEWLSSEWIGRCLRRVKVLVEKRRIAKGMEVKISVQKLEDFLKKRGIEINQELIEDYKEQTQEKQKFLDKWEV